MPQDFQLRKLVNIYTCEIVPCSQDGMNNLSLNEEKK